MRTLIFRIHLTIGAAVAAIVLVLSCTGVLLAFQRQIVGWNERAYRVVPPSATVPVRFAAIAAVAQPRPTAITIRSDRTAPATVAAGRERTLLVDPWTGKTLGEGAKRTRAVFRSIEDVHRWLGASAKRRGVGRAITGAANGGFLLLVLSGIYLWWPTKVVLFRGGLAGRPRNFNWHNVLGIWAWAALVIIVASGVMLSYARGGAPPRQAERPRGEGKSAGIDFDRLGAAAMREASQRVPNWKSITLRIPSAPGAPLVVAIDAGNGARPDLRSQMELDANGRVTRADTYAAQGAWRRLRAWARWSHTGEAAGITGQIIAALASAAACVLAWTGIALALHRLRQLMEEEA